MVYSSRVHVLDALGSPRHLHHQGRVALVLKQRQQIERGSICDTTKEEEDNKYCNWGGACWMLL